MLDINNTPKFNTYRHPSFNGTFEAATQALQFINESPAIGATLVDVGSMALPRTIVDSKRGVNAGIETGIRETSGSVNHAMIGTYGLIGALLAANAINSKYGINARNVRADMPSVRLYSDMWLDYINKGAKNISDEKALRAGFIGNVVENIIGLDNNAFGSDYWKKLPNEAVEDAKRIITKSLEDNNGSYKISKEAKKQLSTLLAGNLGTEQHIKIKFFDKELPTTIDAMLNDTYALSKTFCQEKVKPLYVENNKNGIEQFLKTFGKYKGISTAIGLGLGCAIGASVQPLNRYLTKRRTGNDGFVGVEEHTKKPETNKLFKFYKGLAVGAMGLITYSSLGRKPSAFIKRIQFKGLMPTIDQFRLIYGVTIMSRFMAARDTNELRESTFKDILGFTNWLVLGGFVSKLVAKKLNPDLVSIPSKAPKNASWLYKITNSTLKTQNEVLLTEAKKAKVALFKDGKARSFKEILKDTVKKSPAVKAKIRGLNVAQLAGFIYSGVVLGWAIPKINILVTKKINEDVKKPKSIQELHAERLKIHQ